MRSIEDVIALCLLFVVIYALEVGMVWVMQRRGWLPLGDDEHVDGRN